MSNQARDLSDYGSTLARSLPAILIGALVGAIAGWLIFISIPPQYSSMAGILLFPSAADTGGITGGRSIGTINMDTEAQLATSQATSSLVKESLNTTESVADLSNRVSTNVPANTSILELTFSDASPPEARVGAEEFAKAYLTQRAATASERSGKKVVVAAVGKIINAPLDPEEPSSPSPVVIIGSAIAVGGLLGIVVYPLLGLRRRRARRRGSSDGRTPPEFLI